MTKEKLKLEYREIITEKTNPYGTSVKTTSYYTVAKKRRDPKRKFTFRWKTGIQTYVEGLMARITLEERVSAVVAPVTAKGNPARIDGAVAFASSDEAVATVVALDDTTVQVTAVGLGVAQISATFDADMDAGEIREVVLTGAVEVVEAEAVGGELVFGTPELQP